MNMKKFQNDSELLAAAIEEAKIGLAEGGIPIGSVLVRDGDIIARGHNRRVQNNDPLEHAEINCLRNAGRIGSFRGLTLVSTLMPCYLCAGAAVQFGIARVIAGESQNFAGARQFMESQGIEVVDLNNRECIDMMARFIAENSELWNEDIGK
ncbi:nucleoside deaminase [bacterium]|nr:nucleoside deaminase [bacterium]